MSEGDVEGGDDSSESVIEIDPDEPELGKVDRVSNVVDSGDHRQFFRTTHVSARETDNQYCHGGRHEEAKRVGRCSQKA
jgi:hypothetical protein